MSDATILDVSGHPPLERVAAAVAADPDVLALALALDGLRHAGGLVRDNAMPAEGGYLISRADLEALRGAMKALDEQLANEQLPEEGGGPA